MACHTILHKQQVQTSAKAPSSQCQQSTLVDTDFDPKSNSFSYYLSQNFMKIHRQYERQSHTMG